MNNRLKFGLSTLLGLFMLLIVGCNKENKGDSPVINYRSKYLGDFQFKVITENWVEGDNAIIFEYDTTLYNGLIRGFINSDSIDDLYNGDDSNENPQEKITIEFKEDKKITSLINQDGDLIPKTGMHYHHEGNFTHLAL